MLENLSTYLHLEDYRISILPSGLHILKYKNVLDVTGSEALIKVKDALVKVNGSNMRLITLDKSELLITGKIKNVEIK